MKWRYSLQDDTKSQSSKSTCKRIWRIDAGFVMRNLKLERLSVTTAEEHSSDPTSVPSIQQELSVLFLLYPVSC